MLDFSKLYNSEYFDISVSVKQDETGKVWVGEVLLRRKDTGEEVRGGCLRYGGSEESVKKEIQTHLNEICQFLSVPPNDWNCRPEKVLANFRGLGKAITGFAVKIQNIAAESDETEEMIDGFFSICTQISDDTIAIVREIEKMTSEERIEILTSDDSVYSDKKDPWNLDDLTSRAQIIKYFLEPSVDELKQNQTHKDRMK